MTRKKVYSVLLLLLVVISCSKNDKPNSPIIAKVGKEVFTVADLAKMIPDDNPLEISDIQIQNFVKRWIEMELVYQDALENKFNKDPKVAKELRKVVRDYLVARYIEEKIDSDLEVTEEEIKEYYNRNSQEYIRQNNFYKIRLMLLKTYREAEEIRRKLGKGESFATLAQEFSLDASKENNGELGWVTLEELPQVIAARVPSIRLDRITSIKSLHGYYIVQVTQVRKKGDTQTLEEVKDLLTWRIMAYKRDNKYRRLVTYLGENAQVETNWGLIQDVVKDSSIH